MIESILSELTVLGSTEIDPAERRKRLAVMHRPEYVVELAAVDPLELGGLLERIRVHDGAAGSVGRLESSVKRERREIPPPLRTTIPGECQSVTGWLEQLECPWTPADDVDAPEGYQLRHDGAILRVRDDDTAAVVSLSPIVVVGRAEDPDTGTISLVLVWRYAGRWYRQVVPRRTALTRDGLLSLAGAGIPVDQASATPVAQWIAASDAVLMTPAVVSAGRMGWVGDVFLLGPESIGGTGEVIPPGAGEAAELARYTTGGTWDGWRSQVWDLTRGHPAQVAILASIAVPLLHVVTTDGWTLDIGGERGTGKSTAQSAAASVWGRGVMIPWPRTWAGVRNAAQFRTDVPTILDDTKNCTSMDHVRSLVYAVASDRSQVMGAPGGGSTVSAVLRTIVISSGEAPIAESLEGAQGATQRLLTLSAAPYAPGSREIVTTVDRGAERHYGHAGRRLVEWLVRHRTRWPALRERWMSIADEAAALGEGDGAGRLAPRIALILLAAEVAREALGLESDPEVIGTWADAAMRSGTSDHARSALQAVSAWLASRSTQVEGYTAAQPVEPVLGVWDDHREELAVIPAELDRELVRLGYVPAEIRRQWCTRGWVEHADGRTTARRTVRGRQIRCVVISRAGVRVGGAE